MGRDIFYVASSIPYVNAEPHVGTAYEIIACDLIARYRRMRGEDVYFLTGTDEHSHNVAKSAAELDITPQEWTDRMVPKWREVWERLLITNDDFIRTSEPRHAERVQLFVQRLHDRGQVFLGSYEGPYCPSCEEFKTESELVDGNCPIHGIPVQRLKEDNYFFPLSAYQEPLLRLYEERPEFILPEVRRNEIVSFVKGGLQDLSICRSGSDWGIPVPVGPQPRDLRVGGRAAELHHRAGLRRRRGLLRPRVAVRPPRDRQGHHAVPRGDLAGAADGGRPRGPAHRLRPRLPHPGRGEDVEEQGHRHPSVRAPRPLRRGLLPVLLHARDPVRRRRQLQLGVHDRAAQRRPRERTGQPRQPGAGDARELLRGAGPAAGGAAAAGRIPALVPEVVRRVDEHMDAWALSHALGAIWELVDVANKYLVETEPWALAKDADRRDELGAVLYTVAETLRILALLILPAMPSAAARLWSQLGLDDIAPLEEQRLPGAAAWGGLAPGTQTAKGSALFPRLDALRPRSLPSEVGMERSPDRVSREAPLVDRRWRPVSSARDERPEP